MRETPWWAGTIKDTVNNNSRHHGSTTRLRLVGARVVFIHKQVALERHKLVLSGKLSCFCPHFLAHVEVFDQGNHRICACRCDEAPVPSSSSSEWVAHLAAVAPILHLTRPELSRSPSLVVSWSPTAACPSTSIRFLLPWILPNLRHHRSRRHKNPPLPSGPREKMVAALRPRYFYCAIRTVLMRQIPDGTFSLDDGTLRGGS